MRLNYPRSALLLLCLAALPVSAVPASGPDLMENITALIEDGPIFQPPSLSESEVIEIEKDDPETYTFVRGAIAHPPAPLRLGGDGLLFLLRQETGERVRAAYRRRDGTYDEAEVARLTRLMRCRITKKEAPVSLKLLEILDAVEDEFGGDGLLLLSGYRTPLHNRSLPGSARRSLHMLGWAADIRLKDRPSGKAAEFAKKLGAGGVGHYPGKDFVHLDAGRARSWEGGAPPKKKTPSQK